MSGFKIICQECSRETFIKNRKRERWKGMKQSSNNIELKLSINYFPGDAIKVALGLEVGEFVCKCGNRVQL